MLLNFKEHGAAGLLAASKSIHTFCRAQKVDSDMLNRLGLQTIAGPCWEWCWESKKGLKVTTL